jgi:predicted ester cyclase
MKKSLWVIAALILLCFVVSCQDKAAMAELEKYKAQAALEEQNKALVTRLFDAFQKGDIEAIKEVCSPDYVSHSRGRDDSLDVFFESIKVNKETFSELTIIIQDMIAEGNKVAVRYIAKGTHRGSDKEGEPVIAAGTKMEVPGYDIERVENGKIVEGWDGQDNLSLFEQLGYELKPKKEKKK